MICLWQIVPPHFGISNQTANLPLVILGVTSENGDGLDWCCFVGGAEGERVIAIGTHLLLLGEREFGLCSGSNSRLRFKLRVAPQAISDNFIIY